MAAKESGLIRDILIAASNVGGRLFRANSGMGWTGRKAIHTPKGLYIKDPRPFHGMPKGHPDLAGWTTVKITPEMVGRSVAIYTAIECKTPNTAVTKQQKQFISVVKQAGGIAGLAKSTDEFQNLLDEWKESTTNENLSET